MSIDELMAKYKSRPQSSKMDIDSDDDCKCMLRTFLALFCRPTNDVFFFVSQPLTTRVLRSPIDLIMMTMTKTKRSRTKTL